MVTIGVEEEFLLVDPGSHRLAKAIGDVFPIADDRTPDGEVSHELKRTMIEIGTPVCSSLGEVREHLVRLRRRGGVGGAHLWSRDHRRGHAPDDGHRR